MAPQSDEKRPKETDAIKHRLENFASYQRRIDNLIERLARLEDAMNSPSTPNLSGMPGGSGGSSSKTERQVVRKMELERRISDMVAEEKKERAALELLISLMEKPDEATVIEMHYFDGAKWWPICAALFSHEPDYEKRADKYLKRTFKIHGSALQSLTRLQKETGT